MFFYTIFTTVAFFSLIEIMGGLKKSGRRTIFILFSFFFYVLSFLRWEYGTDWIGYTGMFERMNWNDMEGHEFLFSSVMILARNIFGHYTYALFFLASILFYFQTRAVLKLSSMPLTVLFVLTGTYFCNVGFVRQNVAMAIILFSITFILKKQFLPFVIFVLIASGFHYSALVFIPAWWIFNVNFTRKQILFAILLSLGLYVIVTPLLSGFGNVVGGGIGMRIEEYTELGLDYEDESTMSTGQLILKALLNRGLFFVIGFYLYYKPIAKQTYFKNFFNLYIFGTVLFFLTSPISIILTRMSWFYDYSQILIVPYLFMQIHRNNASKFFVFLLLTIILGTKLYFSINAYGGKYSEFKLTPLIENTI